MRVPFHNLAALALRVEVSARLWQRCGSEMEPVANGVTAMTAALSDVRPVMLLARIPHLEEAGLILALAGTRGTGALRAYWLLAATDSFHTFALPHQEGPWSRTLIVYTHALHLVQRRLRRTRGTYTHSSREHCGLRMSTCQH